MSATVSRFSHTWAAGHRLLLALAAFAAALAASVVIVVITSAGSSPSSSVQPPGQVQTRPAQPDDLNRVRSDLETRCLQGLRKAC